MSYKKRSLTPTLCALLWKRNHDFENYKARLRIKNEAYIGTQNRFQIAKNNYLIYNNNFGKEKTSFFFFLVDRNLFHFFHFPLFFFILIRTCGMFRDKTCHHVVSPGFFVSKEPEIVCWVIGYTGVSLPNNSRPGSVACEGG